MDIAHNVTSDAICVAVQSLLIFFIIVRLSRALDRLEQVTRENLKVRRLELNIVLTEKDAKSPEEPSALTDKEIGTNLDGSVHP